METFTVYLLRSLSPLSATHFEIKYLELVNKLEQSGVKTLLLDYPGMIHGFMQLPSFFPDGKNAIEKVAFEIKKIYIENEM